MKKLLLGQSNSRKYCHKFVIFSINDTDQHLFCLLLAEGPSHGLV